MDQLQESFGRLSTTAREWKPQSQSQSQSQQQLHPPQSQTNSSQDWQEQSELNAAAVKEFVPGIGWSTQTQTHSVAAINSTTTSTSTASGAWERNISGMCIHNLNASENLSALIYNPIICFEFRRFICILRRTTSSATTTG